MRTLVILSVALALSSVGTASAQFNLDHFKCYKVKELKKPKFEKTVVDLQDQFAVNDGLFEARKPFLFCNPTDKNGEGITDMVDHLTCYKVKGPNLDKRDRLNVEVVNQLGTLRLQAQKPLLLCVPSLKTILPQHESPIPKGKGRRF